MILTFLKMSSARNARFFSDKSLINVSVEEKSTGELSIGAGFQHRMAPGDFRIRERNLLGKRKTYPSEQQLRESGYILHGTIFWIVIFQQALICFMLYVTFKMKARSTNAEQVVHCDWGIRFPSGGDKHGVTAQNGTKLQMWRIARLALSATKRNTRYFAISQAYCI